MATETKQMIQYQGSDGQWKTHTVMAGMFSLLRADSGQGGGTGKDEGTGRMTPTSHTPIPSRRAYDSRSSATSFGLNGERKSSGMRGQRLRDLHPILRRSICTVILSLVAIVIGIFCLVMDILVHKVKISVMACVFLGIGGLLLVIGLIWFKFSNAKLDALKKKEEEASKVKQLKMNARLNDVARKLASISSKHAVKWPTRRYSTMEHIDPDVQLTITNTEGNIRSEISTCCQSDDHAFFSKSMISATLPLTMQNSYRYENEYSVSIPCLNKWPAVSQHEKNPIVTFRPPLRREGNFIKNGNNGHLIDRQNSTLSLGSAHSLESGDSDKNNLND